MELQDLRQGDARYHPRAGRVEALSGRSSASSRNLDGPQELGVLHDGQETQPLPSLLVSVLSLIRLQVDPPPRTLHGKAKRVITETGPWQQSLQQRGYGSAMTGASHNPSPRRSSAGRTGERHPERDLSREPEEWPGRASGKGNEGTPANIE